MKLTEQEHLQVMSMLKQQIDWDIDKGKRLEYDNIQAYIDRVIGWLHIETDEEDNSKIFSNIEYSYRITHTTGQCIFSDYDDRHDWYDNNTYTSGYWTRYRQHLIDNTNIDINSINLLDETTLPNIMNCLGNPKDVFDGTRLTRGLIIGDVQSGKTATYSGLICKAADAGYKVVILLAGITESLRQQTQERIDEGIIGYTIKKQHKSEIRERVGVGKSNHQINASPFTSCVTDFVSSSDKIATSLHSQNSLVLFVVKKNVSVLNKLYSWLKELNLDPVYNYVDVPMLLIDDEADNASVNTRRDETDPTRTNKLIRNLCNLFKNATYVGFTATPFANVFIDPDSEDSMKHADLFPEHFIYALPTPSNYVGANRIFYSDGDCHKSLRYITDIDEPDYASDEYRVAIENDLDTLNSGPFYYRHKKEWNGTYPASLRESILCFFLANVIRDLRGNHSAPRSMLINMSRFVKVQHRIAEHVNQVREDVFNTIRYDFAENTSENKKLPLFKEFKEIWDKHFSEVSDVTFADVLKKHNLISAIEKIKVMVINGSKNSDKLDYKTNKSIRVIAVGGIALSRGLTLEGLLVSYFYRNTATFDVLMQMGRWFGYRHGYEDIFQIWTTPLSASWYAEIARSSDDLKRDIRSMFDQQLTPKDFGIKVRDNCDELQITASNKMRNTYNLDVQYSYYGRFFETPYISLNAKQNKKNWEAVASLTRRLFDSGFTFRFADIRKYDDNNIKDKNGASRFFENVPKQIVIDFISTIKCSLVNMFFNVENILAFLRDPENAEIENWNIVFVGGESKKYYDIPGLENIQCATRTVYYNPKRVIQITSRRRLLSASAGKLALYPHEIKAAEESQRKRWVEEGSCTLEEATRRNMPMNAYFAQLPHRTPVLYIVLVEPSKEEKDDTKQLVKFMDSLGSEKIVAFGIGLPAVDDQGKSCHYKANKTYYTLNMLDDLSEEEEDEE